MFFVWLLSSKLAASHTARWHEELAGRRALLRELTTATLLLGSMADVVDRVVSVAHPIGRTEHYAIRQYTTLPRRPRKATSRDNGKGRKQNYGAKAVAGGGSYVPTTGEGSIYHRGSPERSQGFLQQLWKLAITSMAQCAGCGRMPDSLEGKDDGTGFIDAEGKV